MMFLTGLYLLIAIYTVQAEPSDLLGKFCDMDVQNYALSCSAFSSFDQLDFKQVADIAFTQVTIAPNANLKLPLDSKLNLDGLILLSTSESPARIKFRNIYGFDPYFNPFLDLKFTELDSGFDLEFESSVWEFKSSDLFMAEEDCQKLVERKRKSDAQKRKNLRKSSLLFSDLSIHTFSLKSVSFNSNDSPLCPLLFKDSSVDEWIIDSPRGRMRFVNLDIDPDLIELVNITVSSLSVVDGFSAFLFNLNANSLLNELIFSKLKSLSLRRTSVNMIEAESLGKLKLLKHLSLVDLNLRNVLIKDSSWLKVLNAGTDFDWSNGDESQLAEEDYFKLVLGYDPISYADFNMDDTNLCLFKQFPHNQLVIPLLNSYSRNISNVFLPCTCTVFWLYQNYPKYSHRLSQFERTNMVPSKCLNVPDTVFDEQLQDCGFHGDEICDLSVSSTTVAQTSSTTPAPQGDCLPFDLVDPQWGKYCTCSLSPDLNILQCSNSSIEQVPSDFRTRTNVSWSYVTFAGSSISELNSDSFRFLRLRENATLVFQNIRTFRSDIFSPDLIYENKFRLLIRNSSMGSLAFQQPFRQRSYSELTLEDCAFETRIPLSNFLGCNIDVFQIKAPKEDSSLFIRPAPAFQEIFIKKFRILDAYDVFRRTQDGFFGLDGTNLNFFMLQYTEELEVANTQLDYIQPGALAELSFLKTIRLENVHIKSVIKAYFDSLVEDGSSQAGFDDPLVNWVAKESLERIYLGREHLNPLGFEFEDEFLCFFAGLRPQTRVFIYDSIDFKDGIRCTCTVYWLYHQIDLSDVLATDPDSRYIPKCIRDLATKENVNMMLGQCLASANLGNPLEYCRTVPTTTQTSTTTTTTVTLPVTTKPVATTTTTVNEITSSAAPTSSSISSQTSSPKTTTVTMVTTTVIPEASTTPPVTPDVTDVTSSSAILSSSTKPNNTVTTTTEPGTVVTVTTVVTKPTSTTKDAYLAKLDKISRQVLILGLVFGISLLGVVTGGFVFIYIKLARTRKAVPVNKVQPEAQDSFEMN